MLEYTHIVEQIGLNIFTMLDSELSKWCLAVCKNAHH